MKIQKISSPFIVLSFRAQAPRSVEPGVVIASLLIDKSSLTKFFPQIYWVGDSTTSVSTSSHIVAFSALRLLSIAKSHIFIQIKLVAVKVCPATV